MDEPENHFVGVTGVPGYVPEDIPDIPPNELLDSFAHQIAILLGDTEHTEHTEYIEIFPGIMVARLQGVPDPLFNQFFAFVAGMNHFFPYEDEIVQGIVDDITTEDLDNWTQESNELPLILDTRHYRDMEDRAESNLCSICAVKFRRREVVALLKCEHFFHERCIRNWGKVKPSCPICRKGIEVSVTGLEEFGILPE